jgi:hypothetical protein
LLTRSAHLWPEVRDVFARHSAFLYVTTIEDPENAFSGARILTAAIGGLIATLPGCLGVLWGNEFGVAHPTERWLEMSRSAFAPYPD